MEKEIKCPKCGSEKRGFHNKKQRYLCKECGCYYTGGRNGYPDHIKRKAIQLYLEGNGFRRIERILKVSHVSVINWVKKAGAKLEKIPKQDEKVEVWVLDELCINSKKNLALDCSRPCYKAACRFSSGNSRNKTFQKTL